MTSPPDKLFRDGLEHYRKPAPSSAWERIESGLDRKRNPSPWMKIAAGLLLVLATSVLIWQQNHRVSNGQLAVGSSQSAIGKEQGAGSKGQMAAESRQSSGVSREESNVRREESDVRRETVNNRESSGVSREVVIKRELSDSRQESVNVSKETIIASIATPDEEMADPMPTIQVEVMDHITAGDIAQEQKGTNMMYTAEEVNAKFLRTAPAPDATPEKKNTSGLQKVIDRALDLRYEESVLADLREKKNEWLSLNIPPKQRETNK